MGTRTVVPLLVLVVAECVVASSETNEEMDATAMASTEEGWDAIPLALSVATGMGLAWLITRSNRGTRAGPPAPSSIARGFRAGPPTRGERKVRRAELDGYRHDRRDHDDGSETEPETSGGKRMLLIAVKGDVFDVLSHPSGEELYGRDGPYASFAGRDATVGLALSSYDPDDFEGYTLRTHPDVGWWEMERLEEWHATFLRKYDVVGTLETTTPVETSRTENTRA